MLSKFKFSKEVIQYRKIYLHAIDTYKTIKNSGQSTVLIDRLKNLMFRLLILDFAFTSSYGLAEVGGSTEWVDVLDNKRRECSKLAIELFKDDINFQFRSPYMPEFSIESFSTETTTLLREAAIEPNEISKFFELGVNPNLNGSLSCGNTPLIWFVANANNEKAIFLVREGLKEAVHTKIDLNAKSVYFGNTALILSVAKGHNGPVSVVTNHQLTQCLLNNGADPDIQDQYGNTALHIACLCRDITSVNMLLEAGAHILKNADEKEPNDMFVPYKEAQFRISLQTGGVQTQAQQCYILDEKEFLDDEVESKIRKLLLVKATKADDRVVGFRQTEELLHQYKTIDSSMSGLPPILNSKKPTLL